MFATTTSNARLRDTASASKVSTLALFITVTCAAGCGGAGDRDTLPRPAPAMTGAVYALTNAAGANQVVVYQRAADGTLTMSGSIATGGGGSGTQLDSTDSLGSQDALILSEDRRFLLAVNTETSAVNADHDCNQGSISVLRVGADGNLTSAGKPVASGGLFPNSLTMHRDRVYVLNAGGPDSCTGSPGFDVNPNITGFSLAADGTLTRIPGATRQINPGLGPVPDACAPATFGDPQFDCGLNPPAFVRSAAQVSFTPRGDALVVAVKGTNSIHVFPIGRDGAPGAAVITRAPGPTLPTFFGFDFDANGNLVISEPFGAATTLPMGNAGAVSSFRILADGHLTPISTSVPNGQGTTCWVAIDPLTRRYAYTSNNAGNSLSVYEIAASGALTHLSAAGQALASDGANLAHPNELAAVLGADATGQAVSYLYSLHSGTGKVGAFRIGSDGALTPLGEVNGLPASAGAQGMAAF
jgi:6-phosphogluconolactonase